MISRNRSPVPFPSQSGLPKYPWRPCCCELPILGLRPHLIRYSFKHTWPLLRLRLASTVLESPKNRDQFIHNNSCLCFSVDANKNGDFWTQWHRSHPQFLSLNYYYEQWMPSVGGQKLSRVVKYSWCYQALGIWYASSFCDLKWRGTTHVHSQADLPPVVAGATARTWYLANFDTFVWLGPRWEGELRYLQWREIDLMPIQWTTKESPEEENKGYSMVVQNIQCATRAHTNIHEPLTNTKSYQRQTTAWE